MSLYSERKRREHKPRVKPPRVASIISFEESPELMISLPFPAGAQGHTKDSFKDMVLSYADRAHLDFSRGIRSCSR